MFTRRALIAVLLSGIALPMMVSADNSLGIRLNGLFVGEIGVRSQNLLPSSSITTSGILTSNQKNSAFFTGADINLGVEGNNGAGLKYGAVLSISTTTSKFDRYDLTGSYLYTETAGGRVEIGSRATAADLMKVSAYDSATGRNGAGVGSWSNYYQGNPYSGTTGPNATSISGLTSSVVQYATVDNAARYTLRTYGDPVSTLSFYADKFSSAGERSRRITYYTPKISGLQVGVSYTPDSSNVAANSSYTAGLGYHSRVIATLIPDTAGMKNNANANVSGSVPFLVKFNVKNLVSAGLTYDHDFNQDTKLRCSISGETGTTQYSSAILGNVYDLSADLANSNSATSATAAATYFKNNYKFNNVKSYNLGAAITRDKVTVSGSYSNLGKAFLSAADLLNSPYGVTSLKATKVYTGGITYRNNAWGVGVMYFGSSKLGANLSAITLGADCALASGVKAYADITRVRGKSSVPYYASATSGDYTYYTAAAASPTSVKRTATVFDAGVQVSF